MKSPEPNGSAGAETRPYSSAVRANQVRATRRAIVAAAGELFLEQGYAGTTIDAVAERAGVGRKTVFASVGGKGALLKLAWDWALAGDDEPVPMAERPAVQAILAERDPARLVRMWVDLLLDVGERATPMGAVVMAAADVDADARDLRDLIRTESLAGATAFVTHLAGVGGLRADVSLDRAAEACWALVNSLLLHLLVVTRGWSMREYGDWLVRVAAATLLEPAAPTGTRAAPAVSVVRAPERYEASVDGLPVGHLSYEQTERLVVLIRTEVDADLDDVVDDVVAATLVRRALDDVRADGSRHVVTVCPYASWWIDRHPEYAALVLAAATGAGGTRDRR